MDHTDAIGQEPRHKKGKAFGVTPEQYKKFFNREEYGIVYQDDGKDMPEVGGMIAVINEKEQAIMWLKITHVEKCNPIMLPPHLFRDYKKAGANMNAEAIYMYYDYVD